MLRHRTSLAAVAALLIAAALPAAAVAAPPANDGRAGAIVLPGTGGTHATSNAQATYNAAEEGERVGTGTHSVWYRWTAPKAGRVTLTATSNAFDTVLGVYADTTTCCLWASADDFGANTNASVAMDVNAGQVYLIAVDGYDPADFGLFTIAATFDDAPAPPANDAFDKAPLIGTGSDITRTMYHQFTSSQAGEPVHRGKGPAHSLWYTWTPAASGGTNVSTSCSATSLYSTNAPVVAVYTGTELGALDEVSYTKTTSGTCGFAQFRAIAGKAYRIAVDAPEGLRGSTALHIDQDTTEPTVHFPPQSSYGPNAAVPFGASPDTVKTSCLLDDANYYLSCNGKIQLSGAAGGTHKLKVIATDAHGNVSTPHERTFEVDVLPADTAITSGPGATTRDETASVEFSSEAYASFECRVDGAGVWKPCTSPFVTPYHPDGATVKVEVRASDQWGQADPTPATRTWTVDRVAPQVELVGDQPSAPAGQPLTWAFASEPGVAFACSIDYGPYEPCTSPVTVAGSAQPTTRHLVVRATDAAGNEGTAGWRGFQTEPVRTTTTTTTNTTTGTNGTSGLDGTSGTSGAGGTNGTTPLRVNRLRVPRTLSRRVLARRGVKAITNTTRACVLTVELRAGSRLLVRETVQASGVGTVLLRGRPAVAAVMRRLKVGTVVTVHASARGATPQRAAIRLTR